MHRTGGNVARILREDGGTVCCTYDLADGLVVEDWRAADHSQVREFACSYDAAGNRAAENKNGQPVYFYHDDANELVRKNAPTGGADAWTQLAHDNDGSMLRGRDVSAGAAKCHA